MGGEINCILPYIQGTFVASVVLLLRRKREVVKPGTKEMEMEMEKEMGMGMGMEMGMVCIVHARGGVQSQRNCTLTVPHRTSHSQYYYLQNYGVF